MIGKPEWFQRRKYSGWGLTPKTWQGWVYILIMLIPYGILQLIPFGESQLRIIMTLIWSGIFILDVIDIMIRMKIDERERIHEAISERNALWGIMIVLVIGIGYQAARSSLLGTYNDIDWFLIGALFVGVIVKSVSNIYLDRKN